jgi:carboxylate-amine ligase
MEFIDDVVDELGSRQDVNYIHTILRDGTSADRQLRIFRETNNLAAVTQQVVAETRQGVAIPERRAVQGN